MMIYENEWNNMNPCLMASFAAMCLFNLTAASGGGLPEPGLVMYGVQASISDQ